MIKDKMIVDFLQGLYKACECCEEEPKKEKSMINEFYEWKSNQPPFTEDNKFFEETYKVTQIHPVVREMFKQICEFDKRLKVLEGEDNDD